MNFVPPIATGGGYVAASYVVFLALVVIYVAIMAAKLVRLERDLSDLTQRVDQQPTTDEH